MRDRNVQVYAAIVDEIKARIARGELVAGERLPSIQQLAEEFGVGTGSIREAARVLAAAGALRIEHGRGMFIAEAHKQFDPLDHFEQIGTGSVLALLEARRILEPELAALAAERGSDGEIRTIGELATAMERLIALGADFLEPDVQFHRQIAQAAQNPVLARMMEGVNDLLLEGRKLTMRAPGMNQRAAHYHTLIAGAIADRNPLQARLLMLAHVNDAIEALLGVQNTKAKGDSGSPVATPVLLTQRSLVPEG